MGVRDITTLSEAEWDEAVSATGQPFRFSHRAAAGKAFEAAYPSYRFDPCRVAFADGTIALFPLIRVARRFAALSMALGMPLGWEGTPVAAQGEVGAAHIRGLFRARGGRGLLALHGGAGSSPPAVGRVTHSYTHKLDLTLGYDALWTESFSSACRNKCRKAMRAGIEVHRDAGQEAVDAYYILYAAAARRWGYSEPPYPRRLFEVLLGSEAAELWLAHLEGRVIAGALMVRGSDDLTSFSTAYDREHAAYGAGNLVTSVAVKSACERGIAYHDMGASLGLRDVEVFKEAFGAGRHGFRNVELSSRTYRRIEGLRARFSRSASLRVSS